MPRKRTLLKRIRKMLEYLSEGVVSSRTLGDLVGLSHTKVQEFQRSFNGSDYSIEELLLLDNDALSRIAYPHNRKPVPKKPMPDFAKIDRELCQGKKNGVTRTLLWQEYIAEHPDGYRLSQFNEHYRRYRKDRKNSRMVQERVPGERVFVDYSGLKMSFVNPATGELHECELFVASLGVSGKIYAVSGRASIPT